MNNILPLLYLTSTVALCYGAFLGYIKTRNLLQETPFSIIIFSLGLFVVVFSIKNAGGLEFLHIMLESLAKHSILTQIFSIGFLSAFGSSVINNLPMVLLGNLALESFSLESLSQVSSTTDSIHKQALVFAHLLGCNIGSKITPIGSLATLLWLSKLSIYGVKIPILYYMGFACILSLCVLCAALFGLWVSLVFLAMCCPFWIVGKFSISYLNLFQAKWITYCHFYISRSHKIIAYVTPFETNFLLNGYKYSIKPYSFAFLKNFQ